MPDRYTHGDSLVAFLTGAVTHSGAQTDDNLSIGNHQSSTQVQYKSWDRTNPISNLTIVFVSGANPNGDGTITALSADTLAWQPAGGTQGAPVTIANGETKILEAGGGSAYMRQFVVVTRTSASNLTGTETLTVADAINNAVGFDDISESERAAGDTEYRCICFENLSPAQVKDILIKLKTLGTQRTTGSAQLGASGSGTIQTATASGFADWPEAGYGLIKTSGGTQRECIYYSSRTDDTLTVPANGRGLQGTSAAAGAATDTIDCIPGIAMGLDPVGTTTTSAAAAPANDSTAPAGVTFTLPVTTAEALDAGDLNANQIFYLWLRRQIAAGETALANVVKGYEVTFESV